MILQCVISCRLIILANNYIKLRNVSHKEITEKRAWNHPSSPFAMLKSLVFQPLPREKLLIQSLCSSQCRSFVQCCRGDFLMQSWCSIQCRPLFIVVPQILNKLSSQHWTRRPRIVHWYSTRLKTGYQTYLKQPVFLRKYICVLWAGISSAMLSETYLDNID